MSNFAHQQGPKRRGNLFSSFTKLQHLGPEGVARFRASVRGTSRSSRNVSTSGSSGSSGGSSPGNSGNGVGSGGGGVSGGGSGGGRGGGVSPGLTRGDELGWLLFFYSPSCSHTEPLVPLIEELAEELAGFVNVAAVNAEEQHELAGDLGVMLSPTIMRFRYI